MIKFKQEKLQTKGKKTPESHDKKYITFKLIVFNSANKYKSMKYS